MSETVHILAAVPLEPSQRVPAPGVEQPPPSHHQQQMADDVFSDEQSQFVAALMGAQLGIGLLHTLALETFAKKKPEESPKGKPPRLDEEQPV